MKRNTKFALAVIAATAVGGAIAAPVLAHGSGGDGHGRPEAQNGGGMGNGMMGKGRWGAEGDHGGRGQMGGQGQMGGMGDQRQMKNMMQKMMRMQGGMGGMNGMGGMGGKLFGNLDANGDGQVTPEEAKAGREAALKKYDANGDGTLSLTEFQALFNQAVREKMVDQFQALDNDGDGQVTAAEVTAPADKLARMQKAANARKQGQGNMQGQSDMMQTPQTQTAPKN